MFETPFSSFDATMKFVIENLSYHSYLHVMYVSEFATLTEKISSIPNTDYKLDIHDDLKWVEQIQWLITLEVNTAPASAKGNRIPYLFILGSFLRYLLHWFECGTNFQVDARFWQYLRCFDIGCLISIKCGLDTDYILNYNDDVIKWKKFPWHWPFVQGIHRSPANSLHKG